MRADGGCSPRDLRHRRRRAALAGVLALVVAVGAGACRVDPEVTAAEDRACDAGERLGDALRAFTEISEDDDRSDELADARDELFDAMAEMTHASSELAQAEGAADNNPFHDLSRDIRDIPDDATLTEVAQRMSELAGQFLGDVKRIVTGRDCQ